MRILVTGVAGFIGMHVAKRYLANGDCVFGIDNLNDYYDPLLKQSRVDLLYEFEDFTFVQANICDNEVLRDTIANNGIDVIIHLAAQAGVRYSLENPQEYIDTNISGFLNVLEAARSFKVKHLVYASSSSVYGANEDLPFTEEQMTNHPLSMYAVTKKTNELMAHTYSALYGLPTTGLRFFTVYGPWGRPDMALFKFTESIIGGKEIEVFNSGNHLRDFTYIDDICDGIHRVAKQIPLGDKEWNGELPSANSSKHPWKVYNIGNSKPVKLFDYIEAIEHEVGIKAKVKLLPMQPGDVASTHASTINLTNDTGFASRTNIQKGVANFIDWYRNYYGKKG